MRTPEKIINKTSLSRLLESAHGGRASFVLCHGHFNVIHPGHMRFLRHARECGDILVVALISDAQLSNNDKLRYFPQQERAESVASLGFVDHVVILDGLDLSEIIMALSPLTIVMGKEFESERRQEVEDCLNLVSSRGGKVVFHSGDITYSSSDLFYQSASLLQHEKNENFRRICTKLDISSKSLRAIVRRFNSLRVLVVGDTIVDKFVACDALGMSAEAPVIVLRELEGRQYIGGAAIVASHVRQLGAKCRFISVCGADAAGKYVRKELAGQGIESLVLTDSSRPTTFKIRYMVENQKMFRVSRLEEKSVPTPVENKIIRSFKDSIHDTDGILICDFVYGVITPNILDAIQAMAKKRRIPIFGDLQCSSQIGSLLKFKDFELVAPTEREMRIALSDHDSGLEKCAMDLLKATKARNLLVTLGANGFIAYHNFDGNAVESEHFPALCATPIDTAGAGDALFSTVALCRTLGADLMLSAALGACAASIAVNRLGNIPISAGELLSFVESILPIH